MELKKALELQLEYYGKDGIIKVDTNGYICLNDLNEYFPNKNIKEWLKNKSTEEFIKVVDDDINLNRGNSPHLESLITKRGRFGGGTFAHKWVAQEFAMWLSPEFKLSVIKAYESGTQNKQDWNIKRILASSNYKLMCEAVKNDHETPKHYHYSNEAKMINNIVFGESTFDRELANEDQLNRISEFEQHNATLIMIGKSYQERKEILTKLFIDKATNIVGVKNDES